MVVPYVIAPYGTPAQKIRLYKDIRVNVNSRQFIWYLTLPSFQASPLRHGIVIKSLSMSWSTYTTNYGGKKPHIMFVLT